MSRRDRDSTDRLSRRAFLWAGLGAAIPMVGHPLRGPQALQQIQDSLAGRGTRGTLRDPSVVGRSRSPTDARENNAEIQAIEQRLACNCGCTLDVFTCRTTDFSCTYSPALHREVLALYDGGKTAREILDAFVEKYGEKALMAPKPQGFNLAGYFLPAAAIAAAAAGLVLFIGRRRAAVSAAGPGALAPPPSPAASPEELARLRSALAELED
jgi:cytochrome c-type biogenesis protein CcmH/NrfF